MAEDQSHSNVYRTCSAQSCQYDRICQEAQRGEYGMVVGSGRGTVLYTCRASIIYSVMHTLLSDIG